MKGYYYKSCLQDLHALLAISVTVGVDWGTHVVSRNLKLLFFFCFS